MIQELPMNLLSIKTVFLNRQIIEFTVSPTELESVTFRLEGERSIQLSYEDKFPSGFSVGFHFMFFLVCQFVFSATAASFKSG